MLAQAAPAGSFPPPPLTLEGLVWVERNHSAQGHPVGRPLFFLLMEAAFLPCSTGRLLPTLESIFTANGIWGSSTK